MSHGFDRDLLAYVQGNWDSKKERKSEMGV